MKRLRFDTYKYDEGEPAMRSCWECNGAHGHLKDVTFLHYCMWCDRYWIFGHFLDEFDTPEKMDAFLKPRLESKEG